MALPEKENVAARTREVVEAGTTDKKENSEDVDPSASPQLSAAMGSSRVVLYGNRKIESTILVKLDEQSRKGVAVLCKISISWHSFKMHEDYTPFCIYVQLYNASM